MRAGLFGIFSPADGGTSGTKDFRCRDGNFPSPPCVVAVRSKDKSAAPLRFYSKMFTIAREWYSVFKKCQFNLISVSAVHQYKLDNIRTIPWRDGCLNI